MLAVPLLRSMRTLSPVLRIASPPSAAASGEALRIDGEPDVPDCRPSPMQGSERMPRLISAAVEGVRVFRVVQIAIAEFLGDHAGLHDRGIEEIAAQHQEAGILHQRLV